MHDQITKPTCQCIFKNKLWILTKLSTVWIKN